MFVTGVWSPLHIMPGSVLVLSPGITHYWSRYQTVITSHTGTAINLQPQEPIRDDTKVNQREAGIIVNPL